MRLSSLSRPAKRRRSGKILVQFALLLPVLLGMTGLVVDGGLMMAAYRQTQNAADAAAMAAALDKLRGSRDAVALSTANQYVQQYNGLANAPALVAGQTFNIPPKSGPYAGNPRYVEVIVTYPVNTFLIQVLGINPNQMVQARAVAGYEPVPASEGVAALDPGGLPGLQVTGGGTLTVKGRVVVDSQAVGAPFAASVSGGALLRASAIDVVGQVNSSGNFQNLVGQPGNPLTTGALPESDPLQNIVSPTTANGVNPTDRGSVSISSGTQTLDPGIYSSLQITGGNVTLNPGIYVLTGGMTISGSATVQGNGVMFYNTGTDYNPASVFPDQYDGTNLGTDTNATFGGITINAANVNLQALSSAGSPFNGMLIYQRRWNTQPLNIQASPSLNLGGTVYAKWAALNLTGQGQYNAQSIVGTVQVTLSGDLTIDYSGRELGQANQVFLVE
jgi:Flp pilus assembly protein TadG